MPTAEIIAPRLPQVVRVVGREGALVHDLHFEGLRFAHTEWEAPADWASSLQAAVDVPGALFFDWARRCSVRDSAIEHVGTYAVEVGVGCADLEIAHNRMVDLLGGVFKAGPNVVGCQVGIVLEDFVFRNSSGQEIEHVLDADAETANARTPAALLRVDCYSLH